MTAAQPFVVASAEQADPRRWRALAVLALVQFMILIDNSVVNVALPTIQHELGFGTAGLGWVVNGYLLTAGGLLLLGGRLGDVLGRRRMFVAGVAVFAAASLVCGLAPTAEVLVAGRFAQGVGEALASPAALSMIALLFPAEGERAKALSVWGGVTGIAATCGVLLSGVVTGLGDWRWLFFVNLPVAAFALVAVRRLAAESRADGTGGRIGGPSAVLVTAGLLGLTDGVLAAGHASWTSPRVLVPLAGGVALLAALVLVERGSARPLVPAGFFANRVRVTANVLSVVLAAGMTVFYFLFTLYLQDVLGLSPLHTGLAYLPFCGLTLLGYAASSRLLRLAGPGGTLATGFALAAGGMLWLSGLPVEGPVLTGALPATLVLGLGLGICFPALTVAALDGVTGADAGIGSGVQATTFQLGGALGLATFVTVALRHERDLRAGGMVAEAAAAHGYRLAFGVLAGGAVFALSLRRKREQGSSAVVER